MKKTLYTLLAVLGIACAIVLYSKYRYYSVRASQSKYENAEYWFDNGREIDESLADVFYILPTCVFDWQDSLGVTQHFASLTDEVQRGKMQPSYELADEIFADSANFFAPYYRHITLDSWMEGDSVVAERFPYAMADIYDAFHYYLKHWNNGRPFVLAGFSQGAKCVVELMKNMDADVAKRMVAAYVCGYRITQEDLAASANIKPASSANDTGVTIAYNTVADTLGICPTLSEGNVLVTNPASWTTDFESHPLNDSVSICIDPQHKVLVTTGIEAEKFFVPSLANIFPLGNLHLQELLLYKDVLKENVKTRIRAFTE